MFLVNKCWSTNVSRNWEEWYLEIRKIERGTDGALGRMGKVEEK